MPTALVTGASAGIGLAFARHLAAGGHDLVLVARNIARLEDAAGALRTEHGVRCDVLPADLGDRADLQRVADRLADADRPVDLVVSSAGHAIHDGFLRSEAAEQEQLLDIHCRAVLVLTHAAGRAMAARGHGAIVNVSSVAGFTAGGTYAAAKAWVTTFSEGVAAELARKGVTVTALCPGFVRTDLVGDALTSRLPKVAWVDVDVLVSQCLDDVRRGRVVSIPTKRYALLSTVLRLAPRSAVRRATSGSARPRR